MKDLLGQTRRPQINSRSELDACGRPGLPDVIRCARRKHARAIISSFLRNSGIHQDRLSIAMMFLLFALSSSASAATLPSGFVETTVASGIASSTAMAIAPNGRIFVCSQTGALRVIKNGVLLATPFVTLSVDWVGERGLLVVGFVCHFNLIEFIYVYYRGRTMSLHSSVCRLLRMGEVCL